MNIVTSNHVQFITPLITNDDKTHFLHLILANSVGLTHTFLDKSQGIVGEYHAQNGDILQVSAAPFGYILELPKRKDIEGNAYTQAEELEYLMNWVNEEVGTIQGMIEPDVFDTLVPADRICLAALADVNVDEEHEEGAPTGHIFVSPMVYAAPEGVHLKNGDVAPLVQITDDQNNPVFGSYIIQLFESTSEDYIKAQFPHLIRTVVSIEDSEQVVYLDPSITDVMLQIN